LPKHILFRAYGASTLNFEGFSFLFFLDSVYVDQAALEPETSHLTLPTARITGWYMPSRPA
jgi:hypothetical protein